MEEWKPVPGHEGSYEVSSEGRVRSLDRVMVRKNGSRLTLRGKELLISLDNHNRPRVNIEGTPRLVHQLVLEAFVSPRPTPESCGLHYDDDPTNNRLSNLRWGTHTDNMRDMLRNGNHYNANKTRCLNGHELSGENLREYRNGERIIRICRACEADRNHRNYLKRRNRF